MRTVTFRMSVPVSCTIINIATYIRRPPVTVYISGGKLRPLGDLIKRIAVEGLHVHNDGRASRHLSLTGMNGL